MQIFESKKKTGSLCIPTTLPPPDNSQQKQKQTNKECIKALLVRVHPFLGRPTQPVAFTQKKLTRCLIPFFLSLALLHQFICSTITLLYQTTHSNVMTLIFLYGTHAQKILGLLSVRSTTRRSNDSIPTLSASFFAFLFEQQLFTL